MTTMTNEKYYYNAETEMCLTKAKYIAWFNEYGNKDVDGWEDAESWFSDMLHDGLLTELENIVAVFEIDEKLIIIEKFDNNDFSIYFDGGSYRDDWKYIAEYFSDNFGGKNLNDYVHTTNLK